MIHLIVIDRIMMIIVNKFPMNMFYLNLPIDSHVSSILLYSFMLFSCSIYSLAFSPNGEQLLVAAGSRVLVSCSRKPFPTSLR